MCVGDHPHGGGRGKSKGNVHPVSPWGIPVSSFLLHGSQSLELTSLGQIWLQDS